MLRYVSIIVLALFCQTTAFAFLITGGGFQYDCIAPNTYEISLDLYVNCTSIVIPPNELEIQVYSESCGFDAPFVLPQIGTFEEAGEECEDEPNSCELATSFIPGITHYRYSAILTLNEACEDWTVSYQKSYRNDELDNIVIDFDVPADFYTYAIINNTAGRCNSSPRLLSSHNPSFCLSKFDYALNIVDPDEDEFSVQAITPLSSKTGTIVYEAGFDLNNPMLHTGDFNFDSVNWILSATPSDNQLAAMAVLVEEIDDNGNLVGAVVIDYQITIASCFNDHIDFTLVDPVQVCEGDSIGFAIQLIDEDELVITTNIADFPADLLTVEEADTTTLTITWASSVAGEYLLEINATDEKCPYPSEVNMAIPISIYQSPTFSQIYNICSAGESVNIYPEGGSNFIWDSSSSDVEIIETDGSHVIITPSNYVVGGSELYTVTNECGEESDVTINFLDELNYDLIPEQTICEGERIELYVNTDNNANFTFEWTAVESLSDPSISNPEVNPTTDTTYEVIITNNDTQCSVTESVNVTVSGLFPNINIAAEPQILCEGQSTQLNAVVQTQFCGENTAACIGGLITKRLGQVNSTMIGPYPFHGAYPDTKHQFLFRADELISADMISGKIEELSILVDIAFTGNGENPMFYEGLCIKMACTPFDELNSFLDSESLTTVMTPIAHQLTNDWNTFQLTTPYNWDGESNLVVEVCYNNPFDPTEPNVNDAVVLSPTNFNSTAYELSLDANCEFNNPDLLQQRPVMSFGVCETEQLTADYTWAPTESLDNPTIKNPIASPSTTTTYYVEVDNGGCLNTDSITIEVTDFSLDLMPDTSICDFTPFNLRIEGAEEYSELINFEWSPDWYMNDPTDPNTVVAPEEPVTYHLIATTETGCVFEDSIRIDFDNHNMNLDVIPDTILCKGEVATLYAFGADSVDWSPEEFLSCTSCETPTVNPYYRVVYTVTAYDENGCVAVEKVEVDVASEVELSLNGLTEASLNEVVNITANGNYETINWTANIPLEQNTGDNINVTVSEDITLIATAYNELGCTMIDSITIKSIGCQIPAISNAFTPNNDGINDNFGITKFFYEELTVFNIYDRWGQLIFTTTDPDAKWDGTTKGELADIGVYVFYLEAVCEGEQFSYKGNITLLR